MSETPATDAPDSGRRPSGGAIPDHSRPAPGGTLRRDIASAYVVTAARVATWATISAIVFRRLGSDAFAMLALIRSTVGLLAYTSLGLAPAMVRALAEAMAKDNNARGARLVSPSPGTPGEGRGEGLSLLTQNTKTLPLPSLGVVGVSGEGRSDTPAQQDKDTKDVHRLSYATPGSSRVAGAGWQYVYASGEMLAWLSALVGVVLSIVYALLSLRIHTVPELLIADVVSLALGFGFGMVLRLLSEAPASLLQVRGRITLDNSFLVGSELVWLAVAIVLLYTARLGLFAVGLGFVAGNIFLFAARSGAAQRVSVTPLNGGANWQDMRRLLLFGIGVAVAQAADFLYAPTDYILINRLIGAGMVAVYAPAVQIDSGLLLIVTGLAAVLLPHGALAHAAGDRAAVRRYYVRGTLASIALLVPAAVLVWLAAPLLLRLWLGTPMPETIAILPVILLNTVIGGSSAVGRSILLGMGKVRAFSVSVIAAGIVNVIVSFLLVRCFNMGLIGIILGTIVAVTGRCAVWMPWYVLRCLDRADADRRDMIRTEVL